MTAVRTYELREPVSGEYCHALVGRIAYSFDAGTVTPANEHDEIVLEEALVPAGLATRSDGGPRTIVSFGVSDGKVPEGGVDVVKAWVGDDLERAAMARTEELDGRRRSTLLNHLDAMLRETAPAPDSPDDTAAADASTSSDGDPTDTSTDDPGDA